MWEIQSQLSLSLSLHSVPQHENCPCPQDEVQTQDLCLLDMWTGPPPSFLVRAMLPRTEPRLGQVSQSSTTKTVERGGGGGGTVQRRRRVWKSPHCAGSERVNWGGGV